MVDRPDRLRRTLRAVIDGMIAAATCILVVPLVVAAIDRSERRTELTLAVREARLVYDAFVLFGERNGSFPQDTGRDRLSERTLDPLHSRGYYRGPLMGLLDQERVDAYGRSEDGGEFWMELTLRNDPTVRLLICRSDEAPSSGGRWLDGVFFLRGARLDPV